MKKYYFISSCSIVTVNEHVIKYANDNYWWIFNFPKNTVKKINIKTAKMFIISYNASYTEPPLLYKTKGCKNCSFPSLRVTDLRRRNSGDEC